MPRVRVRARARARVRVQVGLEQAPALRGERDVPADERHGGAHARMRVTHEAEDRVHLRQQLAWLWVRVGARARARVRI